MNIDTALRIGVGRTDVTPPLGTRLYGYPIEDRPAESINDPLHSTALVFDRDGTMAALISLDWIIIEQEDVATIRADVQAKTGISANHITVCAIQTHCAPATLHAWGWGEKDTAYVASSLPKIVESVVKANNSLQPARVAIGTTQSDVGINRREIRADHTIGLGFNPWGAYDPTMTVLRFVGDKGPIATLVHYGAHPTSMGGVRIVSRDWPGVMIDRLEKISNAPVLFVNGAVGDVAPRTNVHAATGDGLTAALEVGYRAAAHALRAYNSTKEFRDLDLAVLAQEIRLPHAPLPGLEEAKRELAAAEPNKDKWGSGAANHRYWRAVVEAHAQPPRKDRTFLQVITRLGPIAFVPFAGEPFAEIVLRIRHHSPFQHTLCASTTNGSHGYYVTRESRPRGGYEVWVARAFGAYIFADNIDDVLVDENLKLLRKLPLRQAA